MQGQGAQDALGFARLLDVVVRACQADKRRVEVCTSAQSVKGVLSARRESWEGRATSRRATGAHARTFDVGLDSLDVVACRVAGDEDGEDVGLVRLGC